MTNDRTTDKYKKLEQAEYIVHMLAFKMLKYKREINDLQLVRVIKNLRNERKLYDVFSYDGNSEFDYEERYKYLQENYIDERCTGDLEDIICICKAMIAEIKKADKELLQNNLRDAVCYNEWDE